MNNVFMWVVDASIFLGILAGIINIQYLDKAFKLVVFQLVLALAVEIIGFYYHNTWLFNIYLLAELWVPSLIGILLIQGRYIARVILALSIFCTFIWMYNVSKNGIQVFSNGAFLSGCLMNSFTYLVLLIQLSGRSKQSIIKQPLFWLCMSVIIYFGCNIPCFSILNYLIVDRPQTAHNLYKINVVLEMIRYLFVTISLILWKPKSRLINLLPDE